MASACETSNASLSSAFSPEFEITCEDQDCNTESDTPNKSEAVQFRSRQRAGRQARCTTMSEDNSDQEQEEMDVSEPTGTDKDEPETSSDEPSDLEDGPEGV